jgi:hypothetical protein
LKKEVNYATNQSVCDSQDGQQDKFGGSVYQSSKNGPQRKYVRGPYKTKRSLKLLEKEKSFGGAHDGADNGMDELSISQQESYQSLFGRKMHKSTMKKAEKALKIIEKIQD